MELFTIIAQLLLLILNYSGKIMQCVETSKVKRYDNRRDVSKLVLLIFNSEDSQCVAQKLFL